MNVDELRSVQSRERQTDSLQQLRASFYEDAAEFVQDLRQQRDRAAAKADDPFDSPDVNRLSDDIRTAEQTVEAIYERRVGKIVKMASLAAADMPTEQEGLTKEEQELFDTMVDAIEDHRGRILDVLGGGAPTGAVSSPPDGRETDAAAESPSDGESLDASAVMGEDGPTAAEGGETEKENGGTGDASSETGSDVASELAEASADDEGSESSPDTPTTDAAATETTTTDTATSDTANSASVGTTPDDGEGGAEGTAGDDGSTDAGPDSDGDTERVTVRITEDVGEIFGVDEREYDLATDDVVTLPATNADPLIDRDAAERLE